MSEVKLTKKEADKQRADIVERVKETLSVLATLKKQAKELDLTLVFDGSTGVTSDLYLRRAYYSESTHYGGLN